MVVPVNVSVWALGCPQKWTCDGSSIGRGSQEGVKGSKSPSKISLKFYLNLGSIRVGVAKVIRLECFAVASIHQVHGQHHPVSLEKVEKCDDRLAG
jgi:hypothetical protein